MTNFVIAPDDNYNLDEVLAQHRTQIDKQCQDLKKTGDATAAIALDSAEKSEQFLVLVSLHEDPHIHPWNDLIFTVLEGGGFVQTDDGELPLQVGDTAVIPRSTMHAFHNTSDGCSVLFANFSPSPPHTTQPA